MFFAYLFGAALDFRHGHGLSIDTSSSPWGPVNRGSSFLRASRPGTTSPRIAKFSGTGIDFGPEIGLVISTSSSPRGPTRSSELLLSRGPARRGSAFFVGQRPSVLGPGGWLRGPVRGLGDKRLETPPGTGHSSTCSARVSRKRDFSVFSGAALQVAPKHRLRILDEAGENLGVAVLAP